MSKNVHDLFMSTQQHLRAAVEAGEAVSKCGQRPFPFNVSLSGLIAYTTALRPGPDNQAREQLHTWQDHVAKDERRAIKVLFKDYELLRRACSTLLASEIDGDAKAEATNTDKLSQAMHLIQEVESAYEVGSEERTRLNVLRRGLVRAGASS